MIGAVRSDLRRFEQKIVEAKDWQRIRDDIEVKLCTSPDGDETYILSRSEARKEKDKAVVGRFSERLRVRLDRLQRRLASARKPVDRDRVNRQIGRMLGTHSRTANCFVVTVRDSKTNASGLQLIVQENKDWSRWTERSAGCYLLRSNVANWTEEELWRTYIQLTEAESAFRIQKSDLSIRPVWHQREDRVRAHIFVCFLGYVVWKTLEQWQSHVGLGNSPRNVLDELRHVQSADVVLPTVDGRELKIRCVIKPNEAQVALLDRLGVDLPRRLAIPKALEGARVVTTKRRKSLLLNLSTLRPAEVGLAGCALKRELAARCELQVASGMAGDRGRVAEGLSNITRRPGTLQGEGCSRRTHDQPRTRSTSRLTCATRSERRRGAAPSARTR